jgi:hypothetical protein
VLTAIKTKTKIKFIKKNSGKKLKKENESIKYEKNDMYKKKIFIALDGKTNEK